ncbi:MAG: hypothetical protein ACJ702_05950 [Nitrososphaeraceae archaeon]
MIYQIDLSNEDQKYKMYRDKYIESTKNKNFHSTGEDPEGLDFTASNMMRNYQKLLTKFEKQK